MDYFVKNRKDVLKERHEFLQQLIKSLSKRPDYKVTDFAEFESAGDRGFKTLEAIQMERAAILANGKVAILEQIIVELQNEMALFESKAKEKQ